MFWKKILIVLAAALPVLPLSAENHAAPVSKIVTAGLFEPEGARTAPESRFAPYDGTPADKDLRPTSFRVEYNESFWALEISIDEPLAGKPDEPDNVLEIFFMPEGFGGKYYQFYGNIRDRRMDAYYHGKFHYDYMRPLHSWNVSYSREDGKGYLVRFIFGWEDFLYCLPVGGAEWKFNIVRTRGNAMQTWNGSLHKPETWGTLVFPRFDAEITRELYKRVILHLADKASRFAYPFDGDRYNNRSYVNWRDKIRGDFSDIAEHIGALENAAETVAPSVYLQNLEKMRRLLLTRVFIGSYPSRDTKNWSRRTVGARKSASFEVEYTLPEDGGEFYLTNLSVGGDRKNEPGVWSVRLGCKERMNGKISELPLNIRLGKAEKGTKVSVVVTSENPAAKELPLSFSVETFHNGMMPGPAFDTSRPAITESTPKRDPDGAARSGDFERAKLRTDRIEKMVQAKCPPRVFFIGDSITQGFTGKPWDSLSKFRPVNLGVSGDWIQNVLWRIDLGMFDAVQPELAVLMIGTNNLGYSAEDVAKGIRAVLDRIRKKSPDTKILLLGILPRGRTFPKDIRKNPIARINAVLKTFADGKKVLFMDIGRLFLADDGETVRQDLFFDGLHPNEAGNAVWAKAMEPVLQMLLPSVNDPLRK